MSYIGLVTDCALGRLIVDKGVDLMTEKRTNDRAFAVGDTPTAMFTEDRRYRAKWSSRDTVPAVLDGRWVSSTSVQCGGKWLNCPEPNREASITAVRIGS